MAGVQQPGRRGPPVVARGEVWLVTLDPTVGSEAQKTRPCLIISPAEMHDYLRTVIVAPMTTKSSPAPYRIAATFQGKRGLILLDQVRTLDKVRLIRRLGSVSHGTLTSTLKTLQQVFA
jgi:mRNA interferase MazF